MKINGLPELLSPAGSFEAMQAAVRSGADAVYFGGTVFNARMNAANFDRDSIRRAVEYCHENGVRCYVTLNTLIYDREMQKALEYAAFLYESGVDALIVTDIGLCSLIRKTMPDFPLHASTQMTVHNVYGANILASKGFERVVVARELSKENIETITAKSGCGIEIFVHGAICVSCSGQCLLSAVLGGRSGNRGECAQPCRKSYNGGYPISLKDMCLANHITEIIGSGVASLKIEGRMKSPLYVAGVTSVYRRLLDEKRNASAKEVGELAGLFSRSGFTDGYYSGNINGSMLGIRSESDKQNTAGSALKIVDAKPKAPIAPAERKAAEGVHVELPKGNVPKKIISSARFQSSEQIPEKHIFDITYLPLDRYNGETNGVILPAVIHDSEIEKVAGQLNRAVSKGARHVLISNISHIELVGNRNLTVHTDFRMNVFNGFTATTLAAETLCESVMLSPELTLPQIRDIATGGAGKAVIVYGRLPLMLFEKPVGTNKLRDTKNAVFPIVKDGRRDMLVNSVPIYMADQLDRLEKAGVDENHFLFTTETRGEVMKIIYAYQHGTIPKEPMRRIR